MSKKDTNTTADFLPWEEMRALVVALYRDGDYIFSLLIACGSYLGLRISDLKMLTWGDLLHREYLEITERKTGKLRKFRINEACQEHIVRCWTTLGRPNTEMHCFISRKKTIYSTQRINTRLKEIKRDYHLSLEKFSTHSFRKTYGRRVVEIAVENDEVALVNLSEFFNHSSIDATRKYLGLQCGEGNRPGSQF